jgi:branched-chain amino acid aminotransferase
MYNIFQCVEGDLMKRETVSNYYFHNGKRCRTENMEIFDEIHLPSIYEVIRIINGIPLFLEAHLKRLRKSAELLGTKIAKRDEEIAAEIFTLAQLNRCSNINVKLLCRGLHEKKQDFLVYFIESFYPDWKTYQNGIYAILYYSERENPNAKVVNVDWKKRIGTALKKTGAFEALLVNNDNYVTEGSRSNIFFVLGHKIYTAPSKDVLLGVTREMILNICSQYSVELVEDIIAVQDIKRMDGAFITGTSINVLPINKIDEYRMPSTSNPIIHNIGKEYEKLMWNYIKERQRFCSYFASSL